MLVRVHVSVSVDVDVGVGAIEWKGDLWTTVVEEDRVQAQCRYDRHC